MVTAIFNFNQVILKQEYLNMKKKIVQGVLLGGVTTFLFACNTKTEEPAAIVIDKEQIKQEIQAKENEFAATYNAGELKNIGYYANDATVFYQNRPPLVGRDSIINFLRSDITGNTNKITFTTNEVFPSNDGNQVLELGSFKVVDSANVTLNSGNYMVMFEKRDGKYVSVREMSASDGQAQ